MKKLIALLCLLLVPSLHAEFYLFPPPQTTAGGGPMAGAWISVASLPATCIAGRGYFRTSDNTYHGCGPANTFAQFNTAGVTMTTATNTIPVATGASTLGDSNLINNASGVSIQTLSYQQQYVNNTVTGTTTSKFVKNDGTGKVIVSNSTTDAVKGICVSGCSTSGNAQVAVSGGAVSCIFDNATTAGNYVTVSSAGGCHDSGMTGSNFPTDISVVGIVNTTNGSAGTYTLDLFGMDVAGATTAGGGGGKIGGTVANNQIAVGISTKNIAPLGAMTDGQIIIGDTGDVPKIASITAGSNITITPGAGTLQIAATGGGTAPILWPQSKIPVTSSFVFPAVHVSGSGTWLYFDGLGITDSTTLTSDAVWALMWSLPPVLPSGTAKLQTRCISGLSTGDLKINVKWGMCPVATNCSGVSLSAEGTQTLSFTVVDAFAELLTTLDAATPTADQDLIMNFTIENTGSTHAGTVVCSCGIIFE